MKAVTITLHWTPMRYERYIESFHFYFWLIPQRTAKVMTTTTPYESLWMLIPLPPLFSSVSPYHSIDSFSFPFPFSFVLFLFCHHWTCTSLVVIHIWLLWNAFSKLHQSSVNLPHTLTNPHKTLRLLSAGPSYSKTQALQGCYETSTSLLEVLRWDPRRTWSRFAIAFSWIMRRWHEPVVDRMKNIQLSIDSDSNNDTESSVLTSDLSHCNSLLFILCTH